MLPKAIILGRIVGRRSTCLVSGEFGQSGRRHRCVPLMLIVAINIFNIFAISALADTVHLACLGTFSMPGHSLSVPVTTSAGIDFDRGIISGSIGDLSIVNSIGDDIVAQGSYVDENGLRVFVSFWINRITGKTTVMGTHGDWPELSSAPPPPPWCCGT